MPTKPTIAAVSLADLKKVPEILLNNPARGRAAKGDFRLDGDHQIHLGLPGMSYETSGIWPGHADRIRFLIPRLLPKSDTAKNMDSCQSTMLRAP